MAITLQMLAAMSMSGQDISSIVNAGQMDAVKRLIDAMKTEASAMTDRYGELVGIPPGGLVLGNANILPDQCVSLEYSVGGSYKVIINAPIPPQFNLDLSSNWSPRNAMGDASQTAESYRRYKHAKNDRRGGSRDERDARNRKFDSRFDSLMGVGRRVAGATGMLNTTVKWATAQVWEGPSPIRGGLAFEFVAESDPEKDVILPIKFLCKLATPVNWKDVLIPPGPSIAGRFLGKGVNIKVRVGNIVHFDNVVIDSVNCEMDTILSIKQHKLLHSRVDLSFMSFFAVDNEDIDNMFNVPPYSA